jgi:DNA-binding transcriptional ArsR family regulator
MVTSPSGEAEVAAVARLLADPARAAMLFGLSDGRPLSAGDLARLARVAPATASAHLSKLVAASILTVESVGRHRYYRLANPAIVEAMEALSSVAPLAGGRPSAGVPVQNGIRLARTCYDHLAGALGVRLTEALVADKALVLTRRDYEVTRGGVERLGALGVEVEEIRRGADRTRRNFARACLDWSERRYHLAGALGAALCERLLALDWIERLPGTRAVRLSNIGRRTLRRDFGVVVY